MPEGEQQRKGFGVLGLAIAGLIFLGGGSYFWTAGSRIVGAVLGLIGLAALLADVVMTSGAGLFWRLVILGVAGTFGYSIAAAIFGKP